MFRNYRRRNRGAFTLLELIVVIVILGILAVIAIPSFAGVLKRSKIEVLKANGNSIVRDAVAQMRFDQSSNLADYLPSAASEYVNHSSAPVNNAAGPGVLAAGSSVGVVAYADASTDTVQVYNPDWGLCVQANPDGAGNGAAPSWSSTCQDDPAVFSLMIVTTVTGQPTGQYVAPYVAGATSWTAPGQTSPTNSPVIKVAPSDPAPTVTVSTSSQTAVYSPTPSSSSSGGSSGSTDSSSTAMPITLTSGGGGIQISWSLTNASAASSYSIFRSTGANSVPATTGTPYGSAAQSATSWSDGATIAGTTYCYVMQVTDSYGSVLTSNSACTTTPATPQTAPATISNTVAVGSGVTLTSGVNDEFNLRAEGFYSTWNAGPVYFVPGGVNVYIADGTYATPSDYQNAIQAGIDNTLGANSIEAGALLATVTDQGGGAWKVTLSTTALPTSGDTFTVYASGPAPGFASSFQASSPQVGDPVAYTATLDTSGGLNPGQVVSVTENGIAYSYTVVAGETDQSLIDALNSAFWPDVTASGGSGTITLTDPQIFTVNATGGLTASAVTSN